MDKTLWVSEGQALQLESQKQFLSRHNSHLQNNHCLSCETEPMPVMSAKNLDYFEKKKKLNQGHLSQEARRIGLGKLSFPNIYEQLLCARTVLDPGVTKTENTWSPPSK